LLSLCQLDQFYGLSSRRCKWLFHEYVFAVLERGLRQFAVSPDGSHYRDRIHVRRSEEIAIVGRYSHTWTGLLRAAERVHTVIADHRGFGAFLALRVPDDGAPPISGTSD